MDNDRLCIVIIDFSVSMDSCAFADIPMSKLQVIESALAYSIVKSKQMYTPDCTYLAIIGFTERAQLLGIFKMSEVNKDKQYWYDWFEDKRNGVYMYGGEGSNIAGGLELAKDIYEAARKHDIRTYGLWNVALASVPHSIGDEIYDIERIRVGRKALLVDSGLAHGTLDSRE